MKYTSYDIFKLQKVKTLDIIQTNTNTLNYMKAITTVVLLYLVFSSSFCQTRPFPQNVDYNYGYKPTTITIGEVETTYNEFRNRLLIDCNGDLRVASDPVEETRVEGIGFGMILSAYHGNKSDFDRILDFYKSKRTVEAGELMAWSVTCDGINDPNCATDGDIDVAFGLLVGYNQWGGNYLEEARDIIELIETHLMVTCGDTIKALRPGRGWGGCALTDIQYYTPAFFRLFADAVNDTVWNTLANDAYRIRDAAAHPVTGLVPDWQGVNGTPSGDPPQAGRIGYFRYDACRVPWRMAMDYLWNGDTMAGNWCTKVSDWAYGIGPENIEDGYELDGTPNNSGNHNSSFVGGFTVAAMCNDQGIADDFGAELQLLPDLYWFNLCTRNIYLFAATGNMWKPIVDIVPATSMNVQGEGGVNSITEDNGIMQMEGVFTPENTTITFLDWEIVSGSQYATLDIRGQLQAIGNGTVVIGGTTTDGSDLYDEVEITISNQVDAVNNFYFTDEINIYLNPENYNELIISGLKDVTSVELISITGQILAVEATRTKDTLLFDVSVYTQGSYLVRYKMKTGIEKTMKFIR